MRPPVAAPALQSGRGLADFLEALNSFYRRALLLPEQASSIARRIDALHYFQITVMFAFAAVIAVVALYFVVRFRRRSEDQLARRVTPSHAGEFTLYVGLFSLFILFWVIGFRQFVLLDVPPDDALDVYVTAKQWMWQFSYPEGPESLGVLYVPAGRAVRLHLTSRDVIHSFFVPAFRIKRDAVPGMYTGIWFLSDRPGRYPVFCAEFCGVAHSRMRAEVVVLRPEEFDDWIRGRPPLPRPDTAAPTPFLERPTALEPLVRLAEIGRAAAARHGCLECHSIDGTRHIGPTWLGLYGAWETLEGGERIRVNEAYITESMMDPLAKIVAGFPPVMPSFHGRITPAETAAIIEFMKSLADGPVLRRDGGPPAPAEPSPGAPSTPDTTGGAPGGAPASGPGNLP